MERFIRPSKDGKNTLAAYCILPQGAPRGMVQISHGMCEHFTRYIPFGEYLASLGYLVFGHDHLGHGETASTAEDLGFTVSGGGAHILCEDVHALSLYMKAQYPTLPLVLFGHSMGSFIIRQVLAEHGADYDAAIICGTGGPEVPAGLGKGVASLMMKCKGERYRSKLLKRISFMGYNKRFGKGCDPNSWLTRDASIIAGYRDDPYCRFIFTLRAYHDLFTLIASVSEKDWAGKLPKSLPVLVVSGEEDPVGGYGKGVRTVGERIKAAGVSDCTVKLYPQMRHEILNELDRETVWKELAQWIDKKQPLQI